MEKLIIIYVKNSENPLRNKPKFNRHIIAEIEKKHDNSCQKINRKQN